MGSSPSKHTKTEAVWPIKSSPSVISTRRSSHPIAIDVSNDSLPGQLVPNDSQHDEEAAENVPVLLATSISRPKLEPMRVFDPSNVGSLDPSVMPQMISKNCLLPITHEVATKAATTTAMPPIETATSERINNETPNLVAESVKSLSGISFDDQIQNAIDEQLSAATPQLQKKEEDISEATISDLMANPASILLKTDGGHPKRAELGASEAQPNLVNAVDKPRVEEEDDARNIEVRQLKKELEEQRIKYEKRILRLKNKLRVVRAEASVQIYGLKEDLKELTSLPQLSTSEKITNQEKSSELLLKEQIEKKNQVIKNLSMQVLELNDKLLSNN
ncbi:hypothetical protein BDR26DRAFT_153497 [Obelidium mucronatum]|nr:hypothetical protein BDR26DRAFT_153497 [Obelidium mucronatum]